MRRRDFLASSLLLSGSLKAIDFREKKPIAWNEGHLNDSALALYGKELFSTLQKSQKIEIEAPNYMISKSWEIPINVKTDIPAKSVALFVTGNQQSLLAIFTIHPDSIVNYGLNIRVDMSGTLFAVVEGLDGRLYYRRHYLDVSKISCMAG